jgi:hypothetical protein
MQMQLSKLLSYIVASEINITKKQNAMHVNSNLT